ncbi:hypothetical protein [Nocardioides euryhalodurans]|uniref:DUF1097 domain-containing protein n=1 Tax=Nocardioides euryhalodurans TaxID=2518370 RepID=A0A4V1BDF1_9ACTN|nr:hypothetical protein [Nocardioides euryhalodurans]QBR90902.1 hypothetical protein EXE57_00405 [Nocardioides euryhalodurans]
MRRTLISGLLLVAAAFITVMLSSWLDLELDSVALLGLAAGAVVALVPDATAGRRLAGFALGVFVTVLSYYARASILPDTATGRAVFAALAVALCVGVAMISMDKLPLWSALLGAGTFAGAFEAAYSAAPPRVVDNSFTSITALAMCVGMGFLAAAIAAALARPEQEHKHAADDNTATTDELMETAK